MALPYDSTAKFQDYARPEMLVSTEWLAEHLGDPGPGRGRVRRGRAALRHRAHPRRGQGRLAHRAERPGHPRLPRRRGFARRCRGEGHRPGQHDRALRRQLQLVGGVRAVGVHACSATPTCGCWTAAGRSGSAEGRELTRDGAEAAAGRLPGHRAQRHADPRVPRPGHGHICGQPLVDVRSPGEYTGELLHMPDYPQEGALRGGHIPGARNVPWARAAADDGTFRGARRTRGDLRRRTRPAAGRRHHRRTAGSASGPATPGSSCTHLLGYPQVRNYDGSWTEWGNSVRVPISRGEQP